MTRTNYPKPSNLLQQQKQTGKSYWDMIGYPLPEVTVTANYPHEQRVLNTVNQARYGFNEPEFLRRLDYNDRRYIKTPYGGESTHLMASDGNYAYPMIQDINGTLHNYDKKYGDYWNRDPKENGDYIKFLTPGDARYFAEHYKKYWPIFFQGAFKNGKDMIYNYLPGFKGGFDSFANGVGRAIYNEMIANGWYTPARYDNIMSQLSSESGHGTSMLATKYHNYGGRKNAKGGYMHFKDDSAFAKDHLAYLQRMHRAAWNAKDTMDYVKALKASNYMGDNIYHYYNLLKGQQSARKAWNAAMKTWVQPKQVINTAITEPVDATRVAQPIVQEQKPQHLPTPVARQEIQPTTYIDPSIFMEYPEEIQQPVVEDNYEASLLPSIQDAMQYFLPSQTPFANNDFMSQLVQVGLPGAKYGKDSGIHIKPSHRGRFTRYLKAHPGMTAEKAKHSKSAAVRKMATFAINARHWRH